MIDRRSFLASGAALSVAPFVGVPVMTVDASIETVSLEEWCDLHTLDSLTFMKPDWDIIPLKDLVPLFGQCCMHNMVVCSTMNPHCIQFVAETNVGRMELYDFVFNGPDYLLWAVEAIGGMPSIGHCQGTKRKRLTAEELDYGYIMIDKSRMDLIGDFNGPS